jgi:hypothetical protein
VASWRFLGLASAIGLIAIGLGLFFWGSGRLSVDGGNDIVVGFYILAYLAGLAMLAVGVLAFLVLLFIRPKP